MLNEQRAGCYWKQLEETPVIYEPFTPSLKKPKRKVLINNLSVIRQRIQSEPRGEAKNELQNAVQRELVSFQEKLATAHPELVLPAGPAQPLTHANLNTLIPANDFAYLEYVITDHDVGLFILRRNGVTAEHDPNM